MASQAVLARSDRGPIAVISLDDPERRNALGFAMFDALDRALAAAAGDPGVRVVVLRGEGPVFCAGFDLAEARRDPEVIGAFIERLSVLVRALRRLPQVVVAAVRGRALAGGCAIVSACDLVVASTEAKLGYPVHALGVSPAVTIPSLIGAVAPGAARALLLGGELIDGRAAARLGLAWRVTADADVEGEALALAETIAGHGAEAIRATKAWISELDGSLEDERFAAPARDSAALAGTQAARERLAARLKRG